jgi:YVTN family beta-propeller protein
MQRVACISRAGRLLAASTVIAAVAVGLAMPAKADSGIDASHPDPNSFVPESMPMGLAPKGVAADDDSGFVADFGGATVIPFTPCMPKSCRPQASKAIGAGSQPSAVALFTTAQTGASRAYITNSGNGTLSVVPFTAGFGSMIQPGSTISIGGQPTGVAVSPSGDRVYIADNQRNLLLVLNSSSNAILSSIAVPDGPWGVAVTPDGSRIYVASNRANVVSVIDAGSLAITGSISTGIGPATIAFDQTGNTGYVTNNGSGTVAVVNLGTNEVLARVAVGSQPWGVAVTATAVFVANYGDGTVSVIDPASRNAISTISVGAKPFGVATNLGWVFVTNSGSGTMSFIPLQADTAIVRWSSSKPRRTVTGVSSVPVGIAVTIVGQRGSQQRTGTCRRPGTSSSVTCTIALGRGQWQVSMQTRLPWQSTAIGQQNKRFAFR